MKFLSPIDVNGYISLTTQNPGVTPTKFLIQDANGRIAFRTGQELKVDIGADYTEVVRHTVKASVAINKGQAVYTIPTQNGTNILVGLASNDAESTSSKTLGLLDATVTINGMANVVTQGLLAGLNTATATIGDPVWLGTNGNLIYGLANKPYAPAHLVFIGIVTRVNLNNGEIFVRTQNGFELDELHDVDLKTTTPVNGHILGYNGTLWVNKTIASWLGFTPANDNNVVHLTGNETITGFKTFNTSSTYEDAVRFGGGINNRYLYVYNDGYGTGLANGPLFAGESIYFYNGGNSIDFSTNSVVRAIIDSNGLKSSAYYDFDNTSYYLNPAGSSNLYNVTANSFIKSGGTSSQFLKADGSVDSTSYYPASNPNGYISSYSETDTLATVTTRGATTSTGVGFNNYVNILGQNSVYWYNTGNGAYARTYFDGSTFNLDRSLWVTANIYGDVFYDRNNSAYYVDPASTSYLNIITTAGYVAVGTTSTSYKLHVAGGQYGTYLKGGDSGTGSDILRLVDVFSNTKYLARGDGKHFFTGDTDIAGDLQLGGNYLRFNQSGTRSWNQIASGGNLYLSSGDGSGYFIPTMAMQTPIIYDYNNTGYYLDPASTSNLNGLTVAGTISGNISGNADTVDGEHSNVFALHRGEGRNYIDYSRYVYNNGAYSGSGWVEPSDLGVRYASSSNNSNYLSILGGSGGNLNTMSYGRYYNYGSGSYWINGPSGMSYGSVYNLGGSSESVLSLQLASDINHNSTSSTRTMWFRTGNNLGFQNDWKEILHSGNYTSYANPTIYKGVNAYTNFQSFVSTPGTIRFDQCNSTGGFSNAPGGYTYGGVLSMRGDNFGFQLWGSHTGNFFFKTQWQDDQYSGWREVLHTSNYMDYAWVRSGAWKPSSLSSSTRLIGTTSPDGGEFALAYSAGQIHAYTDGFFYQNEGAYRVMDAYSIGDYGFGNFRKISDYSGDSTWFIRSNGRFVFANAHDWTQTLELYMPSGGSNNNTWAHFGQRASNNANGNFTGISVRRYINNASDLGDLQAGNMYSRIMYDDNDTAYYVNPNSTSNLIKIVAGGTGSSTLNTIGGNVGATTVSWNNAQLELRCSDAGSVGIGFHRAGYTAVGLWHSGGSNLLTDADFYAKSFYDYQNSAYYVDPSYTGDSIRVAGDIVAYYSDERLKDRKGNIENALEKVLSLNGFYYTPNAKAQELGYKYKEEVGVSAQEVEAILPELIKDAPIGQGYKTLNYGKLTPLLIEAIKEQQSQIEELKQLVNHLINK